MTNQPVSRFLVIIETPTGEKIEAITNCESKAKFLCAALFASCGKMAHRVEEWSNCTTVKEIIFTLSQY